MNVLQQEQEILSTREFEVLELIARGCKNREIALALIMTKMMSEYHIKHFVSHFNFGILIKSDYWRLIRRYGQSEFS